MAALDFPDSPVAGQAFEDFVYDATRQVWNLEARQKWLEFEYLVIAGGGGGGSRSAAGGGGAGGYLESNLVLDFSATELTVTVGAGGAGADTSAGVPGSNGTNSIFNTVTSIGGGGGGGRSFDLLPSYGQDGGSGGGAGIRINNPGAAQYGLGVSGQGNRGGDDAAPNTDDTAAGGGGAGGVGGDSSATVKGARGAGLSSSITGSSVYRAEGGEGGRWKVVAGSGGRGGCNNTTPTTQNGLPGLDNTGGGGGGSGYGLSNENGSGGNGGSGVVILKYPSWLSLTVGAGLTSSTATVGSYKVTTFTAGSDDVTVGYA